MYGMHYRIFPVSSEAASYVCACVRACVCMGVYTVVSGSLPPHGL